MVQTGKIALALPGIIGGMIGMLIGAAAFLFSFLSMGAGHGMAGGSISQWSGGILYIMLGMMGIIGTAMAVKSYKLAFGLIIFGGAIGILGVYLSWLLEEWVAIAIMLVLIGAAAYVVRLKSQIGGVSLLILVGLMGFPIGASSMFFLFGGWKSWAIPGVFLITGGILATASLGKVTRCLPLLRSDSKNVKIFGGFLFALLYLLIVLGAMGLLLLWPDEKTSIESDLTEADMAMTMGRTDKAIEAYDRVLSVDPSNAEVREKREYALSRLKEENSSLYNSSL